MFDPRTDDVVAGTLKATHDQGADVVYDCAGIQASFSVAIKAVRPRGNIMNVAIWDGPVTIPMNAVLFKEISLTGELRVVGVKVTLNVLYAGIIGYDRVHGEVIEALATGKFQGLEKLITRKIGLDEVVEKGIKALIAEKDTQSE